MQGYKCKKYTTIQAQGYMSTKLQNYLRIKTVTFQNMLHTHIYIYIYIYIYMYVYIYI